MLSDFVCACGGIGHMLFVGLLDYLIFCIKCTGKVKVYFTQNINQAWHRSHADFGGTQGLLVKHEY